MYTHFLLALGLAVLPATAVTQSLETPVTTDASRGTMRAADSARVSQALARADELTYSGRAGDARKIYRQVIDDQKTASSFAGAAMWRLALNYLYAEDTWRAALTLDELAAAANRFGDPTMELRATFEGAVLWQQLKRLDRVASRVERTRDLLQSPVIAEALKEDVRRRM